MLVKNDGQRQSHRLCDPVAVSSKQTLKVLLFKQHSVLTQAKSGREWQAGRLGHGRCGTSDAAAQFFLASGSPRDCPSNV